MYDVHFVKIFEATENLEAVLPDLILIKPLCLLEPLLNKFIEIAHGGELHNNTEMTGLIVKEGLSVLNDILMLDGGKYSDLVEGIFLILLLHVHDLHLSIINHIPSSWRTTGCHCSALLCRPPRRTPIPACSTL